MALTCTWFCRFEFAHLSWRCSRSWRSDPCPSLWPKKPPPYSWKSKGWSPAWRPTSPITSCYFTWWEPNSNKVSVPGTITPVWKLTGAICNVDWLVQVTAAWGSVSDADTITAFIREQSCVIDGLFFHLYDPLVNEYISVPPIWFFFLFSVLVFIFELKSFTFRLILVINRWLQTVSIDFEDAFQWFTAVELWRGQYFEWFWNTISNDTTRCIRNISNQRHKSVTIRSLMYWNMNWHWN